MYGGLANGSDYRGHPAPLEKYDFLTQGYYPADATNYYLDNTYNPDAEDWWGLCAAWSSAAVYEHIEFFPSSIENQIFCVGDKKGLLTACHELDLRIIESGYDPADFHRWLLTYIKDQSVDFYGDLESGCEVWNFPIYKYQMEMTETQSSMDVSCTIWYASDFVDPDYQGTDSLHKTYTYRLYLESGSITSGEWTGASIDQSPNTLILPIGLDVYNPYLDYELVREIALSKDDYFESTEPADIHPGGYNLLLLDQDTFRLDCDPGDTIVAKIDITDDAKEAIQVDITDALGTAVFHQQADPSLDIVVQADQPPYIMTLSRNEYNGEGLYRLECDYQKSFEFSDPKLFKSWGGLVLVNTATETCNQVFVTGVAKDGSPVATYDAFALEPGEKKSVIVPDFKVWSMDKSLFSGLKVSASAPLAILSLSGSTDQNMCAIDGVGKADSLIIPDTTPVFGFFESIYWGIHNPSNQNRSATLELFSNQGELKDTVDIDLAALKTANYNMSDTPFSVSGLTDGWIRITQTDGADLKAYIKWLSTDQSMSESLPGLLPGLDFTVPHVTQSQLWNLEITVINPSPSNNTIDLSLYNGQLIRTAQIDLNAYEKYTFSYTDVFPDVSEALFSACSITLHGSEQLCGYYTYDSGKDSIYLPLMASDEVVSLFTIPHVASSQNWWTAINLYNPSTTPVTLLMIPYGKDGKAISGQTKWRDINAYTKDVFTTQQIWDTSLDIAYLRCMVLQGGGILGIYAYGTSDLKRTAGSVIKSD